MENMPPEKGFQPLKKWMKFPLLSNTVQQVKFTIKYFDAVSCGFGHIY